MADDKDNKAQVQLIMDLMISEPVKRINFMLGSMKIDGSGFMEVFNALREGRIKVGVGNIPANAAASYDYTDNVFDLPRANYGNGAFEKMLIVHESVHAIQDARGTYRPECPSPTRATVTEYEAAAYVAMAFYYRYAMQTPLDSDNPTRSAKPVYKLGDAIAQKLLRSGKTVVPDDDVMELRKAVAADQAYIDIGVKLDSLNFMNGIGPRR